MWNEFEIGCVGHPIDNNPKWWFGLIENQILIIVRWVPNKYALSSHDLTLTNIITHTSQVGKEIGIFKMEMNINLPEPIWLAMGQLGQSMIVHGAYIYVGKCCVVRPLVQPWNFDWQHIANLVPDVPLPKLSKMYTKFKSTEMNWIVYQTDHSRRFNAFGSYEKKKKIHSHNTWTCCESTKHWKSKSGESNFCDLAANWHAILQKFNWTPQSKALTYDLIRVTI